MATNQRIMQVQNLEVKQLKKRKSGEAFEVIVKTPGQSGDGEMPLRAPTPKKDLSIEDIHSKLEAAEERRKAKHEEVRLGVKAEEEKLVKAKQKRVEDNAKYCAWAEEHLKSKMMQYEENYMSQLNAKLDKYREVNMKPDEIREKMKNEIDQMHDNIQKKLSKSEQLREKQLEQRLVKLKEQESRAQQVRQKKLEDQAKDMQI